MTDAPNPETFNLDDWLNDAHLPEESCRVYKRGDVLSDLTELRERFDDQSAVAGQSLAESEKLMDIRERYEKLLKTFGDSLLTVYVQAVPRSRLRAIKALHEKTAEAKKWKPVESNTEFGYAVVAESVVGIQSPGQPRQEARFSAEDAKRLEDKIGSGQFGAIIEARKRADAELQEPDADFLRKSSGGSRDDTAG